MDILRRLQKEETPPTPTKIIEPEFKPINSFFDKNDPPITRKNLFISPQSNAFLLENFLTQKECDYLINETDRVGYDRINLEYEKNYRDSLRVLTLNKIIAGRFWRRLKPHLKAEDIERVRPFGFSTEGTWIPKGINECMRFSKYVKGGHFQPHKDGNFFRSDNERSIYTLQIYLNESFDGGTTDFYCDGKDGEKDVNTIKVKPKTGTALIFNHDTRHSGSVVTRGVKYIIRTDVMFHRINPPSLEDNLHHNDPDYLEAVRLYDLCVQLYHEGDPVGSTASYLKAQRLHTMRRSIPQQMVVGPEATWFPPDVYHLIFSDLPLSIIGMCATVSRGWHKVVTDNRLWMVVFSKLWPHVRLLESSISDYNMNEHKGNEGILKDWYTCTKYRTFADKHFHVCFVDPGAHTVKCGMVGINLDGSFIEWASEKSNEVAIMPSKWSKEWYSSGWYEGYYRYFIGTLADACGPWSSVNDLWKQQKSDTQIDVEALGTFVEEITTSFSQRSNFSLYRTTDSYPLLIARSPNLGWSQIVELAHYFLMDPCKVPYLAVIDSAVLSLCASGLTTGVVVDFGHLATHVTAVIKGKVKQTATYDVSGLLVTNNSCNVDFLLELYFEGSDNNSNIVAVTHNLIQSIHEEALTTIKLTGGLAPLVEARFKKEIATYSPQYQIVVPPFPNIDVALGAHVFASLSNAKDYFWQSEEDFLRMVPPEVGVEFETLRSVWNRKKKSRDMPNMVTESEVMDDDIYN